MLVPVAIDPRALRDPALVPIADKLRAGERLSDADALALFRSPDLLTVGRLADEANRRRNGDRVFFAANQHLNPTNVCVYRCTFCSFRSDLKGPTAFVMTDEQILARAREATEQGATELHIVGGLHHQLPYEWYRGIIKAIAGKRPDGSALRICSRAVAILGAESFAAFSAPATRMTSRSWKVNLVFPRDAGCVMNPPWLSFLTSAGLRPNSLFRSASEYSCMSPS